MNKTKLIAVGASVSLIVTGLFSFKHYQYTGWAEERIDPYTLKSVCKKTTMVSMFGKDLIKDGPALPHSQCKDSVNMWLTETPNEGCLINAEKLIATCKEAYQYPFY